MTSKLYERTMRIVSCEHEFKDTDNTFMDNKDVVYYTSHDCLGYPIPHLMRRCIKCGKWVEITKENN